MDEYSEPVLNAKIFANECFEICKNFIPPSWESDARIKRLRLKYNKDIVDFLDRVRNSIVRGHCNEKTFKEKIINNVKFFDLEIWWYLMKCEIMSPEDLLTLFDHYQLSNSNENVSSALFSTIFFQLEHSSCFRKDINSAFLELLVRHNDKCENNGNQSVVYNNFLQCISTLEVDEDDAGFLKNTDIFVDSINVSTLKDSKIKTFIFDFMTILLQGKSVPLKDVFYKNEHFLKYEKSITCKSSKILSFLNSDDVITFLKHFLLKKSNSLNWENFFLFLTSLASHYEQADLFAKLKTLILFLLEEALQIGSESLLLHVFILPRHCSYPLTSYFPSYLQWFSSTFSSNSLHPINTKGKARFLMNFLSDVAQYDSPYYMRVHINRVPWVPAECLSFLNDYVQLVKTRLIDLNEPCELGLFDNTTAKSSEEFDVETVLDIFTNMNEIPKCVLEASLICKSYYEKKFLVTLLSKFDGKNSVRHKLIRKLYKLGKIPESLFKHYKNMI